MNYKLEKEAAIESSGSTSGRITKTGAYVGTFTRAEAIESQYGTKGIEFSFTADNGDTADRLQVWTMKSNGDRIFGFNLIMGLMTCVKAREINKTSGFVQKFDYISGQQKTMQAEIYPALMNKDIGVILQAEEYIYNGETKQRMVVVNFFEAATELMAKEILEGTKEPEMMQKLVSRLPEVKKAKESKPNNADGMGVVGVSFEDSDIPF